jgi:hypothetical protein
MQYIGRVGQVLSSDQALGLARRAIVTGQLAPGGTAEEAMRCLDIFISGVRKPGSGTGG